jgi:hypothetical protein
MNGTTELGVYETFEDVFGRKSTPDELIEDIRAYTQKSVLWVCAVIVTGMQLWTRIDLQPFDVYQRLLTLFFDPSLSSRLMAGYWASEPRRILFHRRQILLIAKLAILHCTGPGIDARTNVQRFGPVLLKANDQFHYGLLAELASANRPISGRDDYAKIITEMVAVSEHSSPNISHLITRNHLMLTRFANELRGDPDFVDVAAEQQKAIGLTLEEFEAMIFGVHARFGEGLVKKLFTDPSVLPLTDATFATIAVSAEKVRAFLDSLAADPGTIAKELYKKDNGANDFTIFRRYPLVQQYYNLHLKTAWCGFLMMDNLFFLEKIQTGPYWRANAIHGLKLRKFWGAVFERYVNELMRQACVDTRSLFIPDPRSSNDPNLQICDGIIVCDDSMVLMEYKSSMFRADTKYGGSASALADELEKKLVHDREAGQRKGVLQLSEAVNKLFGSDAQISLPGVDLKKIRHIYLYIVTLDSIGATIGISPFLNTFLDERLDRSAFASLEIRPLFCSDIETLEVISGFFGASSLTHILERWLRTNPSLTTPLLAINLDGIPWRENFWLRAEWNAIFKRMVTILFPDKDPEVALAEAITRVQKR